MKTVKFTLMLVMLAFMASGVVAQENKKSNQLDTVVFSVALHGTHCENIIHKRTPFEKGVVKVHADASTQTVRVIYQSNKTDVQKLIEHFKNIGYEATPLKPVK